MGGLEGQSKPLSELLNGSANFEKPTLKSFRNGLDTFANFSKINPL